MKYLLPVLFFARIFSLSAQPIAEHTFDFKGYELQLKSMETDGAENYLFCGSIESDESIPDEQKDTLIAGRLEKFMGMGVRDYCIVIQTDKTFTVE